MAGIFSPLDLETMIAHSEGGIIWELETLDIGAHGGIVTLFSEDQAHHPGQHGFSLTFIDGSSFDVTITQTMGPREGLAPPPPEPSRHNPTGPARDDPDDHPTW